MSSKKRQHGRRRPRGGIASAEKVALSRMVKQQLNKNLERKFVDVALNAGVSSTVTTTPITDIGVGTTNITRIGNIIQPTSISLVINSFIPITGDQTNFIRFILFQWKDDTGETGPPLIGNILQTAFPASIYNNNQRSSFKILFDKIIPMSLSGPNAKTMKFTIRKKLLPIKYTTGATDGINKIFVMEISDSTTVVHPVTDWYLRVRFTDA